MQTSNERALQVFNGYLNNLFPSPREQQQPVHVEFAVKNKDNSHIKNIQIFLSGADAHSIVRLTLEKCNLSTEALATKSSIRRNNSNTTTPKSSWNAEDLAECWHILQENERARRRRFSSEDLFKELANSRELALQRMAIHRRMIEFIGDEIERIQRRTGATQILWSINWELSFMRRCLINVSAMLSHADRETRETIVHALNGRKLSFGRGSYVCCDGSLQFGADDATGAWQKVCFESTVRRFDLRNLDLLVDRVRELLGGAQLLVRPLANVGLTIQQLQIFIGRVCTQPKEDKAALQALFRSQQVEIVNSYSELNILEDDGSSCLLQIPCNVDIRALKEFLRANKLQNGTMAEQLRRRERFEQMCLLETVRTEAMRHLSIAELTWDSSLTSSPQLLRCLRKLASLSPVSRVGQFARLEIHMSAAGPKIQVLTSGKISVPIEWIEEESF